MCSKQESLTDHLNSTRMSSTGLCATDLQFPLPRNTSLWKAVNEAEWASAATENVYHHRLEDTLEGEWISRSANVLELLWIGSNGIKGVCTVQSVFLISMASAQVAVRTGSPQGWTTPAVAQHPRTVASESAGPNITRGGLQFVRNSTKSMAYRGVWCRGEGWMHGNLDFTDCSWLYAFGGCEDGYVAR